MRKIIFLFTVLGFIPICLRSQCNDFVVYQTRGDVKIQQGATSKTPEKNMKLASGMHLVVGQDAAVILLCGKDKAMRLSTAGTYSLEQVKSVCMKNQSSLTKEYVNYVACSIIEKEEPLTAMVIKGAVYRTREVFEKTAMISPADSSVMTGDPFAFAWHKPSPEKPHYLLIYENGVKEIFSKKLGNDTTVKIEAGLFKPQVIYFWLISDTLKPTDQEVRFTFVTGAKDWENKFLEEWSAQSLKELEGQVDELRQKMNSRKK